MYNRGHNTIHGQDTGPPPPEFFPIRTSQFLSPVYGRNLSLSSFQALPLPQHSGQMYSSVQPLAYAQPPYAPYFGVAWHTGAPQPPDHGFPGTPPGYDYIWPLEHTKIHVFKTKTKPWQSSFLSDDAQTYAKFFVPVTMTTKELMQNLGCCNDKAGNNILYECVEKGNGKWASGMKFKGDEKDKMKATLSSWGWDKSRTGYPGEKPVVWLWGTSEGA